MAFEKIEGMKCIGFVLFFPKAQISGTFFFCCVAGTRRKKESGGWSAVQDISDVGAGVARQFLFCCLYTHLFAY